MGGNHEEKRGKDQFLLAWRKFKSRHMLGKEDISKSLFVIL
jgi:hypothetical protein